MGHGKCEVLANRKDVRVACGCRSLQFRLEKYIEESPFRQY